MSGLSGFKKISHKRKKRRSNEVTITSYGRLSFPAKIAYTDEDGKRQIRARADLFYNRKKRQVAVIFYRGSKTDSLQGDYEVHNGCIDVPAFLYDIGVLPITAGFKPDEEARRAKKVAKLNKEGEYFVFNVPNEKE